MEACCSSSASAWAAGSVPDRRQLTTRRVIPVKCSPFLMRSTAAHRGLIPLAHPLLRSGLLVPVARQQRRARSRPVKAVFDRFTERAIKVVVFTQREAKGLGKDMVSTQHLLPGPVAEERSPVGFLRSGITIEVTRKAVRTIWKDSTYMESRSGLATDMPFSMSCKSVFESEVGASKNMGCKSCVESGCRESLRGREKKFQLIGSPVV